MQTRSEAKGVITVATVSEAKDVTKPATLSHDELITFTHQQHVLEHTSLSPLLVTFCPAISPCWHSPMPGLSAQPKCGACDHHCRAWHNSCSCNWSQTQPIQPAVYTQQHAQSRMPGAATATDASTDSTGTSSSHGQCCMCQCAPVLASHSACKHVSERGA